SVAAEGSKAEHRAPERSECDTNCHVAHEMHVTAHTLITGARLPVRRIDEGDQGPGHAASDCSHQCMVRNDSPRRLCLHIARRLCAPGMQRCYTSRNEAL